MTPRQHGCVVRCCFVVRVPSSCSSAAALAANYSVIKTEISKTLVTRTKDLRISRDMEHRSRANILWKQ